MEQVLVEQVLVEQVPVEQVLVACVPSEALGENPPASSCSCRPCVCGHLVLRLHHGQCPCVLIPFPVCCETHPLGSEPTLTS